MPRIARQAAAERAGRAIALAPGEEDHRVAGPAAAPGERAHRPENAELMLLQADPPRQHDGAPAGREIPRGAGGRALGLGRADENDSRRGDCR